MKNKTFIHGYPCLLSMCETNQQTRGNRIEKRKIKNIKHRGRKKKKPHKDINTEKTESNRKYIKGAVSRNSAKLGNYKMPVKLRET